MQLMQANILNPTDNKNEIPNALCSFTKTTVA